MALECRNRNFESRGMIMSQARVSRVVMKGMYMSVHMIYTITMWLGSIILFRGTNNET